MSNNAYRLNRRDHVKPLGLPEKRANKPAKLPLKVKLIDLDTYEVAEKRADCRVYTLLVKLGDDYFKEAKKVYRGL